MTGRDDDRAVRYLLDELTEADREAFEYEFFDDEQVYGELLAAEDDLIDGYCDGALSAEQRDRFEQRYLGTAEGRERVEFARALKGLCAERSLKPPAAAAPAGLRWLPWAAVLVAAVASLPFGAAQFGEARRARAALQEQLSREQERSRAQDSRLADLGQELSRVQAQVREMEELLGVDAAKGLRSVALVLREGLRRGATVLPQLMLTRDVALVRLQLQIEGAPRPAYRASLQTAEGRELWSRDGLAPAIDAGIPAVTFTVPAALLATGHYVVTIGSSPGRGESDAEYVFTIRRAADGQR